MRSDTSIVAAALACMAFIVLGACGSEDSVSEGVPDEGTVSVDGVFLSYRVVGDGEPCIWVGSAVFTNVFPEQMRALLRCALVDARVWVADAPSGNGYDLGMAVDDLEEACAALGIERAVVVGHSLHGIIAQEYARRFPDRVKGVITIGYGPALASGVSAYWDEHASEERKEADREWAIRFSADSLPPGASDWDVWTYSYVSGHARAWFDPHTDPSWLLDIRGGVN